MQAFVVGLADGGRDETTQGPQGSCVGTDPRPRQRRQARLYVYGPVGVCSRFRGRVPDSRKSTLFPDATSPIGRRWS